DRTISDGYLAERHGQPGLGRSSLAQPAVRGRHGLLAQRSPGKARVEVTAERRHCPFQNHRLQTGRHYRDRVQEDGDDLPSWTRPPGPRAASLVIVKEKAPRQSGAVRQKRGRSSKLVLERIADRGAVARHARSCELDIVVNQVEMNFGTNENASSHVEAYPP